MVCESRRWPRVGGINDDPSKSFLLVVGHVATQGAWHQSVRKVTNWRNVGQSNYACLLPFSSLGLDPRLHCLKATHRSPTLWRREGPPEAWELLCSELRGRQTGKWCSLSAAGCKRRISSRSDNCSSRRRRGGV